MSTLLPSRFSLQILLINFCEQIAMIKFKTDIKPYINKLYSTGSDFYQCLWCIWSIRNKL